MSYFIAKMHLIRFRLVSASAPPDPLVGFKGPTSKARRGEGMGGEGREKERRGAKGRERSVPKVTHSKNPRSATAFLRVLCHSSPVDDVKLDA